MTPALSRSRALAALAASMMVLAACASPPSPPPPPAAPPPLGPVALNSQIVDSAAAYVNYVRNASALSAAFTDGDMIQSELKTGEAYEPHAFARDIVAYAAVLALQEPTFVQGVRALGADAGVRQQIIQQIYADPAYSGQLPGAEAAAGRIVAELSADSSKLHAAGVAVKQAAYDIQHQKWSTEYVVDREGRLAMAKALSGQPAPTSPDDSARLLQAALGGAAEPAPVLGKAQPPYTQGIVRAMSIAALAALSAAGDDRTAQVSPLLDEATGPYCFNLSKLNLFQCLAVAKPHYEDVFCMGQHILLDTSECVGKVAGALAPDPNAPPPLPLAQPVTLDVAVAEALAPKKPAPKAASKPTPKPAPKKAPAKKVVKK